MKTNTKLLAFAASSAAILAAAVPSYASAQSWDVASGWGGPEWVYGQRAGPGCAGNTSPLAFNYVGPSGTNFVGRQGVNTPTIVPLVAKNLATTGTTVYSSAQIPAGAVWLHPGQTGVNPRCAAIRFRAPMAGTFRVKGWIRSIDTGANQVNGYIFANNVLVAGPILLSGPMGTQVPFDQLITLVGMPRNIDFAIDDGGSYYNDSTQLSMTITRCPPDMGQGNGTSNCIERTGGPINPRPIRPGELPVAAAPAVATIPEQEQGCGTPANGVQNQNTC